jgi:ABC-2 type transport system ATP-binding protein
MTSPLLSIDQVRVEYESVVAVNQVSLTVEPGTILGLLGPNGAGKSSLMKAIAGLIEVTSGHISICGHSLFDDRATALTMLGFQPDIPPIYEDLSVLEFLTLFASAYGIPKAKRLPRILEVLTLVRLEEKLDHPTGGLSRGMMQRMFLAKTLIPDPPLLILDEPASGLDPIARQEFADLIKTLGDQGKAVVLSSHVLEELNNVCDSLCVMSRGEILDSGKIEDVRERLNPPVKLHLQLLDPMTSATSQLIRSQLQGVIETIDEQPSGYIITLNVSELSQPINEVTAQLLKTLINEGRSPAQCYVREANLQDLFLQLAKENA